MLKKCPQCGLTIKDEERCPKCDFPVGGYYRRHYGCINTPTDEEDKAPSDDQVLNSFVFESNDQISVALKQLIIDTGSTQRLVAESLGIRPQSLTKIFNKTNITPQDMADICGALDCEVRIQFVKKNK